MFVVFGAIDSYAGKNQSFSLIISDPSTKYSMLYTALIQTVFCLCKGYPLHHTESAWTVGDTAHPRKRDLAEHLIGEW
jgi:hypothetical protein